VHRSSNTAAGLPIRDPNLLLLLVCCGLLPQAKVGQDRPVVLVGHSLGGLVLKKLAMEAHKEAGLQDSLLSPCCKAFCNNLAGTFYYATPHGGAVLGSLADSVFKGPVLDYLTVFSRHGAELNRDFMLAFPTLRFMALVETQKYKVGAARYCVTALQTELADCPD